MTWPCLLAWVPSAMCRVRFATRSSTSTQSPPAQTSSWPTTRIDRSVSRPPCGPSGSPAARASVVSGSTPMPSTTTSAGYVPASVTTADTRPSGPVRISVTAARFTVVMPRPSIAPCTRRPMSGSRVAIGCSPRFSTVTSKPRFSMASAISTPMYPAPTTTARRRSVPTRSSESRSAWPSSSVCTPCTPGASMPGSAGRTGRAPVPITSLSYPVQDEVPVSRSTARTRRPARSISVTSVRVRRSMPRARCSSGVRAIRSSRSATSPPTQYGMPQAEYEEKWPRSKATMLSSSGPFSLRACDAADMPAASPPMTTSRSVMPGPFAAVCRPTTLTAFPGFPRVPLCGLREWVSCPPPPARPRQWRRRERRGQRPPGRGGGAPPAARPPGPGRRPPGTGRWHRSPSRSSAAP